MSDQAEEAFALFQQPVDIAHTPTNKGAINSHSDCKYQPLPAVRHSNFGFTPLTKLHFTAHGADLPDGFPDVEVPRFLYGDRLCWVSDGELTDWGIVIGRFYSFTPHRRRWGWCYLIWLDPDAPSSGWVKADIAWEDDLEPLATGNGQ
ncbi:MAG: hypothetical protein AAF289_01210 [Cyanobacteria bacterium P01_A01_bin.135]